MPVYGSALEAGPQQAGVCQIVFTVCVAVSPEVGACVNHTQRRGTPEVHPSFPGRCLCLTCGDPWGFIMGPTSRCPLC